MFSFFKTKKIFFAPVSGKLIDLKNINDVTVSKKKLGEGFAIRPKDNIVYAPFDAEITTIFPTKHGLIILDKKGKEVLIHIGIDSVNLKGKGFKILKEQGQKVKAKDPLIEFNINLLKKLNKGCEVLFIFISGESIELNPEKENKIIKKFEENIITIN